jgi:hypothetical protein
MKEIDKKEVSKNIISGLNVSEAIKVDTNCNLSQLWELDQSQSEIFRLFLEGEIRMKRAGLGPKDLHLNAEEACGQSKGLRQIFRQAKEEYVRINKILDAGGLFACPKALHVEKFFREGEKLSQDYIKTESDKVKEKEKNPLLPGQADCLVNEIMQKKGSPAAIKGAANLISFIYLSLQEEVEERRMTTEQMNKALEKVASGIKVKASLSLKND